jgi:RNA polymerase I-specific transcription initiation factor RRN11
MVADIVPHYTKKTTSIRKAYIQNLTDLLHVCLLRRDTIRARRAWSILVSQSTKKWAELTRQIRCREIDWRSRWYWGLECLNAASSTTSNSQLGQSQLRSDDEGREVEKWLKGVRVSAKEVDVRQTNIFYAELTTQKPSLLHALVLHLIKHERFRQALDELETYVYSQLLRSATNACSSFQISHFLSVPPFWCSTHVRRVTQLSPRPTPIGSGEQCPSD